MAIEKGIKNFVLRKRNPAPYSFLCKTITTKAANLANRQHNAALVGYILFNSNAHLMITIISGTNRPQSNTKLVAKEYQRLLAEKGVEAGLLALDELDICRRNELFTVMEEKYLIPAKNFIIVMPEYNGSFPGILKLMIDLSMVEKAWWHKKVLLTGVSTGRAGNLRGMEHLTGTLLHMKMLVHPNRLPISTVHTLMDEKKHFNNEQTLATINTQLEDFLAF